ncbi:hypothetical protein ARMSODRAFT_983762 [Armillaria solidipes]|uniref:Uncharacterized protein n=1 Tax=Armillaria solidipes TaxID=1076256 RepID=A0A2H3AP42_9AGAR|nr:hypothetical protein ARMSODRAFT_983762 [Armillaria solidipes]
MANTRTTSRFYVIHPITRWPLTDVPITILIHYEMPAEISEHPDIPIACPDVFGAERALWVWIVVGEYLVLVRSHGYLTTASKRGTALSILNTGGRYGIAKRAREKLTSHLPDFASEYRFPRQVRPKSTAGIRSLWGSLDSVTGQETGKHWIPTNATKIIPSFSPVIGVFHPEFRKNASNEGCDLLAE